MAAKPRHRPPGPREQLPRALVDAAQVARFNARKVEALLKEPTIVRNRAKVESAVKNARAFLAVQEQFGSFSDYQWRFVDGQPIQNTYTSINQIPVSSSVSDALSKDLKKRGFSFVGSTIMYSHMQATGMVNDHLVTCARHRAVANLGKRFARRNRS